MRFKLVSKRIKPYVFELEVLSKLSDYLLNLLNKLLDAEDMVTAMIFAVPHNILFNRTQQIVLKYPKHYNRDNVNVIVQNKSNLELLQINKYATENHHTPDSSVALNRFKFELVGIHMEFKSKICGTVTYKLCSALHEIVEREIIKVHH